MSEICPACRTASYPVGILVLFLLFASCGKAKENPTSSEAPPAPAPMQVDFVVLRPAAISNQLDVTGTLVPAESAMLSAQTAGLVKDIHFREGQQVKKGQLLLQLDDRQWQAMRSKLLSQISMAETDLKRKEGLLPIQGISQAEVDAAQLQLTTLRADLQELDIRIEYASIRAPFSGRVGLRNVSPGAYLMAGSPVVQIVQLDPLRLEFSVPEIYAGDIRPGQQLTFRLAGQDTDFKAEVYASEPVIDATTRGLKVRAIVNNQRAFWQPAHSHKSPLHSPIFPMPC
ncbi:MAG: efflux RND transporter periplasmic adaptor subunit [Saprospiraceae bacterium]